MAEAKKARETLSGDPLFPVGMVLVKNGKIIARAGNGFNKGSGTLHVCPRIVLESPSGTGYDLCHLHDAPGHAEPMVIEAARKAGEDPTGADGYMYGHWWCCEPCWKVMIKAGVRDVYLLENADVEFSRDRVYAQTLKPKYKSVYISGGLTNLSENIRDLQKGLYEKLASAAGELGLTAYVPHHHSDPILHPDLTPQAVHEMDIEQVKKHDVIVAEVSYPSLGVGGELVVAKDSAKKIVLISKKGIPVTRFVRGNPAVVYHIEYETPEAACRMLKNVLKQL
jgi:deoxycytidylate deaminase